MDSTSAKKSGREKRQARVIEIESLRSKYTDTSDKFSLDDMTLDFAAWLKVHEPDDSYFQAALRILANYDRRKRPRPDQIEMFPHDRWIPVDRIRKMRIVLGQARITDVIAWLAILAQNISQQNSAYAILAAEGAKWLEAWSKKEYTTITELSNLWRQAFGWTGPTSETVDHDETLDDDED